MVWNAVAKAEDVAVGAAVVVEVGGKRLALCNTGEGIYAIDDVCTHDGGPLDQGQLDGKEIECPRHGARFDVTNGRALCLPAVRPVRTYPVRIEGGEVEIDLP
jgi:3-phenylpropionate/trans-cinnamate dioxygenase ferredoxin subunit